MADIDTHLADALRDRYLLKRELGRGGMAVVYLAEDLKHHRTVAIKILKPDLAASLGAERLLREIEITAHLTHPNILPLLDSGDANGLLYYVMPYLESESLRERLRRERQLPLDDAMRIAREVADALSYAHSLGLLHRDIKPENILLEMGHAVVSDFGLARAITAAGVERLTASGLAVGTPAYMSPEQALGEPQLDGRSDIYSLGCVLYEMLAGDPPFTGSSAQAVLARKTTDHIPSLRLFRETLPLAVERAVEKALARVPADRFATMAQFTEALERATDTRTSWSTASGEQLPQGPPRRLAIALNFLRRLAPTVTRRPVAALIAASASIALVLVGVAYTRSALGIGRMETLLATGTIRERERLLVTEFGSRTSDTTLGSMVTDAFRIDLTQSPTVTVMSPTQVSEVLTRMQLPATTRLTPPVAREVALRDGVKALVVGEIAAAGTQYVVSASLIAANTGEVLAAYRETASDSTTIVPAVDRLSNALRARIGESLASIRQEPPLSRATTTSLEALRKYSQAGRAIDMEGDARKAIVLYYDAIALDSNFAAAYLRLSDLLFNAYEHGVQRNAWALTKAYELRDRLPPRERHLATTTYDSRVRFDFDKVIAAHRAMLDQYPDDEVTMTALGVAYLEAHQFAPAESVFRRVLASDSSSYWTYISLVDAQLALGKRSDASATFERMVRAFPNNPEVEWWRAAYASMNGNYDRSQALLNALRKRYGPSPYWREWTGQSLASIAAVRGRLTEAGQRLQDAMAAASEEGNLPRYYDFVGRLAAYYLRSGRQPHRALQEIERALARYPLDSLAPLDRPYLMLARIYAWAGQPRRSRVLLAEYERAVDPVFRRMAEPYENTQHAARGELALAEGRVQDAISEFRQGEGLGQCTLCRLEPLARAYAIAGETDSSIAVYERHTGILWMQRVTLDAIELPGIHRALGELYEQQGQFRKARSSYTRFIELWRECDSDLRSQVMEVRRRLVQLAKEGAE